MQAKIKSKEYKTCSVLTAVYHLLDFVVGSVCEIRQSPAGVGQHLPVTVMQQSRQRGQKLSHHLKLGRRVLVSAQVG